ncbi:FAD-dependent oxidoreductase, partial [bacterium]|nr:FAD-dependent oxidoreductase [bacterium]MBU1026061.1 FAD-dependent oxidoreductase [bacterium]
IKNIVDLGIELNMGVEAGKDISFDDIRNGHDAVFIATGARKGAQLPCDGADLKGVESGLELLKGIVRDSEVFEKIYSGETVVIIGGGNVAIDIARTALRLGPDKIHLYCLEERNEMPAHSWEIEESEKEGIIMHPGWGPKLIAGDGKVERVDFRKCTSVFDDTGKFAPRFDESINTSQEADRILIAIGQKSELDFIKESDIKLTARGSIESNPDTLKTSVGNVFAGGEVVSGPASVIDAIAQGRRAASGIDKYLGGDGNINIPLVDETELDGEFDKIENFANLKRNPVPRLSMEESTNCLRLVEYGYTTSDAIREAERCLRCDLRLNITAMPLPPEAWIELNEEGVALVPETDGVYQLLDEKKAVYAIKGVSNLREALSEVLETTEKAKFFLYDEDPMYSKRESELIQEYLKINGRMPPGDGEDDLDDLF